MQETKTSFRNLTIGLASPESVRERSYGEVREPSTIDPQTYTPDGKYVPKVDGLFCEKIFGPVKDLECRCGEREGLIFEGWVCGDCGVEVARSTVRRKRMGHIEFAVPVVHPWYFKRQTNKIGKLLGLGREKLRKIIYRERHVVIQPGSAEHLGVKENQLLNDERLHALSSRVREDNERLEAGDPDAFVTMTGGEAVQTMLRRLDLAALAQRLRYQVQTETSQQRKDSALKRLGVVEDFRKARHESGQKPEWMVLRALPVMPPEMRPLVPLEGGRFATGDLNILYRRIIIRNQKVRRFKKSGIAALALRKEKRKLQEAVDALLDGGGKARTGRSLKPLPDRIEGKQGRFRQNLLGKRVDYSGRTVIVAGPELELHQCGLPVEMAVELFRPFLVRELMTRERFIVRKLVERGAVQSPEEIEEVSPRKAREVAEAAVDRKTRSMSDILRDLEGLPEKEDFGNEEGEGKTRSVLEKVIRDRPVILNRAPTLHRLGIQAFQPVLIEGKAIRLHPLVCSAYNADFDGDQMAVHVPLSDEARREANQLMRSLHNIPSPANGEPVTVPTQDMILGLHHMTKASSGEQGDGKRFASAEGVRAAYEGGVVGSHARIKLRDPDASSSKRAEMIDTTVGRVLFNDIVPPKVGFINETLTKENMRSIITRVLEESGYGESRYRRTARFLDDMKKLGFEQATKAGHTFSLDDLTVPKEKKELVAEADERVEQVTKEHEKGQISEDERYDRVIDIWKEVNSEVSEALYQTLKRHKNGFNAIYMMADSGARGSQEQIRQLGGMRGLMNRLRRQMPATGEKAGPTNSNEARRKSTARSTDDSAYAPGSSGGFATPPPVATIGSTGSNREIIEDPIRSNFKEGLSVLEYFISTHGARKGLADTAVKTADAGYLTRRLVDVAQDVTVTRHDCGAQHGVTVSALEKSGDVVETLKDRIVGRTSVHDVYDPLNDQLLVASGELIGEERADAIAKTPAEEVEIRSVLTCEARRGVCALCYGQDLSARKQVRVEVGEAVGVVAAHSIGEPGTQLTLRTFHTGGAAGEGEDITGGLPRAVELFEARVPDEAATLSEIDGTVSLGERQDGTQEVIVTSPDGEVEKSHAIDAAKALLVREGTPVSAGDPLSEGPLNPHDVLATKGPRATEKHLLNEIQQVYRSQGVTINDKHFEIIVRRMMEHVEVTAPGSTGLIEAERVSRLHWAELQGELDGKFVVIDSGETDVEVGSFVSARLLNALNAVMERQDMKQVQVREPRLAEGRPVLFGITKAALSKDSWISKAGFQEAKKVLTDAAVRAKKDPLHGMKEQVSVGRLKGQTLLVHGRAPRQNVLVVEQPLLAGAEFEPLGDE